MSITIEISDVVHMVFLIQRYYFLPPRVGQVSTESIQCATTDRRSHALTINHVEADRMYFLLEL